MSRAFLESARSASHYSDRVDDGDNSSSNSNSNSNSNVNSNNNRNSNSNGNSNSSNSRMGGRRRRRKAGNDLDSYDQNHAVLVGGTKIPISRIQDVEDVIALAAVNMALDPETELPEGHLVFRFTFPTASRSSDSLQGGRGSVSIIILALHGLSPPSKMSSGASAEVRHMGLYASSLLQSAEATSTGMDYRSAWLTKIMMPLWAGGNVSTVFCYDGDRRNLAVAFFAAQLMVTVGAVAVSRAEIHRAKAESARAKMMGPSPSAVSAAGARVLELEQTVNDQEKVIAQLRVQVRALTVEKRGPAGLVYAATGDVEVPDRESSRVRNALLAAKRDKMALLVSHRETVDELMLELESVKDEALENESDVARALAHERERRQKAERAIVALEDKVRNRSVQIESLNHKLEKMEHAATAKISALQAQIKAHNARHAEKLADAESRYAEQNAQVQVLNAQVSDLARIASSVRAKREAEGQVDDLLQKLLPLITAQAAHLEELESQIARHGAHSGDADDLDITPPSKIYD